MSHVTFRNSYLALSDRLNLFPQGAPPSELLFRILEILFTRDEAALVALLPIKPFNVAAAARVWKKPVAEPRKILEGLASKGMLLDMEMQGEQIFVLPPPMAGFFERSKGDWPLSATCVRAVYRRNTTSAARRDAAARPIRPRNTDPAIRSVLRERERAVRSSCARRICLPSAES